MNAIMNINTSNQCIICFKRIIDENKCILECPHFFCKSCLDSWFNQGKDSCTLCRNKITYYTKNSENYRIIHNKQNRQSRNQIMIDNDHHRHVVVFCRISFILNLVSLYFIFDYMFENESLNRYLRSCITNNTLVSDTLYSCENTVLDEINVFNYNSHSFYTCSFPIHYINKCFNH